MNIPTTENREIIDIVDGDSGKITQALVVGGDDKGHLVVVLVKELKKDGTPDARKHSQSYLGWNIYRVDPAREAKADAARAKIATLELLLQAAKERLWAVYENDRKPGERDYQ